MKKMSLIPAMAVLFLFPIACATSYKATPMAFKTPAAYGNQVRIGAVELAGQAFTDKAEAQNAFGFDVIGAGMLPVQIVFDNQGPHPLKINEQQTFLEDRKGNLWPILNRKMAHERATKYAKTKQIFKEGAYSGFLGAAAGSVIGAAVGIVSGEDLGSAIGKGAAVGAAAGATMGGAAGYGSNDARRSIKEDLREKNMENRAIEPGSLAHGFLFFPAEADSVLRLRLQVKETDSGKIHPVVLDLNRIAP
jgi:uncharacterized membrane protein